jgi:hypothetical protein
MYKLFSRLNWPDVLQLHFPIFATGSAASLDPFADSPNNARVAVKRWDSDIEIISNPSQSSIEVLDEHAR